MADNKKLSTEEIMALARKQKAGDAAAPAGGAAADSAVVPEAPAAGSAPAAGAPKSTADILAAARAQAAGGVAKSAAAKPSSTADILAAARSQGKGDAGGVKPAAAPKSTADILAAARAQAAGGGGGAASSEPAAVEKSPVKKASAPVGDRPALKDMVAAVKEARETGAPAKPKLPVGKPASGKPKLPQKPEKVGRRGFFSLFAVFVVTPFVLAWSAFAAIAGLWSLGIARFMMPNMVLELPSQFKVGPPSDFPPGTVSEKYKASRGVWIVNTDEYDGRGMIYALASVCTHLGCTPNWLEGEQKFKCPCHGSGFYITGVNFEGPAPRPLERVGIRVADDGSLEVDKSLKFQEELGQWSDTKSYVLG